MIERLVQRSSAVARASLRATLGPGLGKIEVIMLFCLDAGALNI